MTEALLLDRAQRLLRDALTARIAAASAQLGDRYGFAVQHSGATTAVLARGWPMSEGGVPFSRVLNYIAPRAQQPDPLSLVGGDDAVIEVLPGAHAAATAAHLRSQGFAPRWRIAWLHRALAAPLPAPPLAVRRVAPDELDSFAALLTAGYGYGGAQAAAWYAVARYGYAAPGFYCFVAEAEQPLAAGVLCIQGDLALVDGAATLPAQRGRGAQTALLLARMAFAQAQGCTHAFSRTGAGSDSQRNLERVGLQSFAHSTAWRAPGDGSRTFATERTA